MMLREDAPVLLAENGPLAGQRWPLTQTQVVIGRSADCDLVIPDRQVSRYHARIRRAESGFMLEDLRSKNGTHLNGQRISEPARLQDGDIIQVALAVRLAFLGSEATVPLGAEPAGPARKGQLRLDALSRAVWIGSRELDPPLSLPQFRLLELLYKNAGRVCSRESIIEVVWPEAEVAGVSEQAIDALVRRVRDRLADLADHEFVATVRGHGFRLVNPE